MGKCFSYGGPFWNTVKDYVKEIRKINPNKKVEFVWNNILKIGKAEGKGAPEKTFIDIQKKTFSIIKEEIEILKPDIIIFFTGPNYDQYIETEWLDIKFEAVNDSNIRKLALLKHDLLPKNVVRTYHPNYMYMSGKAFYSDIKDSIMSMFKQTDDFNL